MYEWLEQEISNIKTPGFHIVDGPASDTFRATVDRAVLPVPHSYQEFVLKFGNARLYKMGIAWLVGVYGFPKEARSVAGEVLRCVGHYDASQAFFKESLLLEANESPVFEHTAGGLRKVTSGFEEWVSMRCRHAKERFAKQRWADIVNGPRPFTMQETAVVKARNLFHWRIVGIKKDGNLIFEVVNGSDRTLPYITVGVRNKSNTFAGRIAIPVSSVMPGKSSLVDVDCYQRQVPPSEIEVYHLPDPEPQDREDYWEFQ